MKTARTFRCLPLDALWKWNRKGTTLGSYVEAALLHLLLTYEYLTHLVRCVWWMGKMTSLLPFYIPTFMNGSRVGGWHRNNLSSDRAYLGTTVRIFSRYRQLPDGLDSLPTTRTHFSRDPGNFSIDRGTAPGFLSQKTDSSQRLYERASRAWVGTELVFTLRLLAWDDRM